MLSPNRNAFKDIILRVIVLPVNPTNTAIAAAKKPRQGIRGCHEASDTCRREY